MSWLYILSLKNSKYYIGSTDNLQQRLLDHSQGKSSYTKKFLPIKLEFSKKFPDISSANKMERYLKSLKSHNDGKVTATKNRRLLRLIHYEVFIDIKDAKSKEVYLKSGEGRKQLKNSIHNTLLKLNYKFL